ncbi:cell wall-binding repeat-containing protein [Candidatus Poriferisodalis sp.]|uniref:cell wall-binding repeat-containing protein n=1 Tax=Candidatus Poriferisodalis sp. TaxID=3101277 RepID=UPI003B591DE8
MSTAPHRRRRILAGVMAALLCASVLAVVAGSPAQAANTSRELLVDTNSDGVGDAREFGGRDRYDTARRLARNFAAGKGGLGQVRVAFVASGATLVDAVAVSGLAGHEDAPVLLTPRDELHIGVADFVEDNGVETVYILGGSAAVADSVLDEIEDLPNSPEVSRIQGADRYATAAAIGSELGAGAAWCGGDEPAAILVNGGDVSLAYAMMAGPLAYRLEVPVLLTARRSLPAATADFLRTEDIEHVVIVGGTDSVAEGVESALAAAGVDDIDRIAGDSAAGTSVELAELAMGRCAADLRPVSEDTVALVHSDALPDGVAAAPVLGTTFADGDLVPMLLVNDALPTPVRDYLAATPVVGADGDNLELKIVAIGGTAAVGADVVDSALRASASADALSVQIGAARDTNGDGRIDASDVPAPGDYAVIFYFSASIASGASAASVVRDIVWLNGAPPLLGSGNPVSVVSAADPCDPEQVTVNFEHPLNDRDIISIVPDATIGSGVNERRVRPASAEVSARAAVMPRPTIDVFMFVGRFTADVRTSDGGPLNEADVDLRSSNPNQFLSVDPVSSNLIFTDAIQAGERVVIRRGAVTDSRGNSNAQRTYQAMAPDENPRILSVLMSDLHHSSDAVAEVPSAISGEGNSVFISGRAGGDAEGAAGNGWSIIFDVASDWTPSGDVDIDVRVVDDDKTAFVLFDNGKARNRDLLAALEAHSAFNALFEVELPLDSSGVCGSIRNTELSLGTNDRQITAALSGGVTELAIEVRFNGYVESVQDDGLLEDILRAVVSRTDVNSTDAVRAALDLAFPEPFEGPGKVVRYEARTSDATMLPRVRDLVDTPAGRDQVFDDPNTSTDETAEAVAAIALGYAPPENDDEKNGRSRVRIARSSIVKPPA